jgi:AraC-like DNA-binding protein
LTMRERSGNGNTDDEREWYRRGVEAYLDSSYRAGSRASTSEFAEQFGTNRGALARAFRRLFQQAPLEYFRSQQLTYAATLLRRSPLTTDQITITAGLGTRGTLFRLFHRKFGVTPDEYRRNPSLRPAAPARAAA